MSDRNSPTRLRFQPAHATAVTGPEEQQNGETKGLDGKPMGEGNRTAFGLAPVLHLRSV